jgi:hypothetical protein
MQKPTVDDPNEIRFHNIIGMGLDFSSMIRVFEKGSEDRLWNKLVHGTAQKIFNTQSKDEFNLAHREFCDWGTKNIYLAERKKNGRIIKQRKLASYGQIAKTLDVTLKVAVYYSHLPDLQKYKRIMAWLNAGVDTRMMEMLSKQYPDLIRPWPSTVGEVDRASYLTIQEGVLKFINQEHGGKLLPVEFDDIYWYKLNP